MKKKTRYDCNGKNWAKTNSIDKHRRVSEKEPRERWMFCWCLNLWKSTNNGYSQLLFIYQITPDSFTIDKRPQFMMMSYIFWREKLSEKYSSKASIWNGWHNSWLRGFFFRSVTSKTIERKFINVPEGAGGERTRTKDRKIKLTVFIMWLCSFAIEDIYSKGHVLGQRKKKSFCFPSFLFFVFSYPSPIQ